jgi:hypothetical protein
MICRKCGGALDVDHDDPDPIHPDCLDAELDEQEFDEALRDVDMKPKGGTSDVNDSVV